MKVIIKPLGYLKKNFKDYLKEGEDIFVLEMDGDAITTRKILTHCNIDSKVVGFVLLNDNLSNLDEILKDGDKVALMTSLAGG